MEQTRQEDEVNRREELLSSALEVEPEEQERKEGCNSCAAMICAFLFWPHICGCILIMAVVAFLTGGTVATPRDPNETEAKRGTEKEDVVAVFGSYEEVSSCWKFLSRRLAKFLALLAQFALNIIFIRINFLSRLPKSDPREFADLAKDFVADFEYSVAFCFLCGLFIYVVMACNSRAEALPGIANSLRWCGGFSVLRALPMANPMNAMDDVAAAKRTKGLGLAVAVGLLYCVKVPAAILAVFLKLYQVDFATEKMIDHWTLFDCLAFAAFINNLFGLMGDITSGKKQAIMATRDADPQGLLKVWEQNLATTLQEVYGASLGLVIFATVSVEDLGRLLNPSLRPDFRYEAREVAMGHPV